MKRISSNYKTLFFVLIFLTFSIIAFVIFFWSTFKDIGVTSDSIVYITGAKSLSAGTGFANQGKPITHFPPGYSFVLSILFPLFDYSLDSIKYLNAVLYVLNTIILGFVSYKLSDNSLFACAIAMFAFVTSKSVLEIHHYAWSEPLFIFLIGASFSFLCIQMQKPRNLFLFGSAILLAFSMLTRYVGITIGITFCMMIMLQKIEVSKSFWKRLTFCLIVFGPLGIWLLFNIHTTGNATNRVIVYHPVELKAFLENFLKTVSIYFVPFPASKKVQFSILLILGIVFFSIHLFDVKKASQSTEKSTKNSVAMHTLIILLTIFYLAFLFFSMSFVDALVPIDTRLLAPLFVLWIIFTISKSFSLSLIKHGKVIWLLPSLLILTISILNFQSLVVYAKDFRINGGGYTAMRWRNSATIAALNSIPSNLKIYTNGADVIYFLTNTQTSPLPQKYSPYSLQENSLLEKETNQLKKEISGNRSIIVYFRNIYRSFLLEKNDIETQLEITPSVELDDGFIYGISPTY